MTGELLQALRQQIREFGPVDIATFMNIVLAHPQYGYYMRQDPFGVKGDFTTAPEISQMFGEMIGVWAADTWKKMGEPDAFILAECGPGRGTLMADALRATTRVDGFHDAVCVHLIETSPVLRSQQEKTLHAYEVCWHDHVNLLPDDKPVIIVANEFFDALPVHQLVHDAGGWKEKVIGLDDNGNPVFGLADTIVSEMMPVMNEGAEMLEVSPVRMEYFLEIGRTVKKQGGAALFIDYGHTHLASGDTLQAVYKHEYCDVLENIGQADITAHVDFASLQKGAQKAGLHDHGPVTQGEFLKALGIELRAQMLARVANEMQREDIVHSLSRIIDDDQMGNLFKVMAVTDADSKLVLAGF